MKNAQLSNVIKHWDYISKFIAYPKNDKELDKLISLLDELLKIVGGNENHPLMGLIDFISYFIEKYESNRYSLEQRKATGIDALKFLIEAHKLNQNDLPEIGSQGVVSEVLNGKRLLNLRQITALSKRFGVNPCTFMTEENAESMGTTPPNNHPLSGSR